MKYSVVMATVDRTEEPARFLASLREQSYRDFELLVIDQNRDDRLLPVLKPYEREFRILRLTSPRGLSRSRNVGLKEIHGDIVAFPDDDCWYPRDVLELVARHFIEMSDWDGLVARTLSERNEMETVRRERSRPITISNVWDLCWTYRLFLRREVIDETGFFDESLGFGSGTPWGAAEDEDYMLRALKNGFRFRYDPTIRVFHPDRSSGRDEETARRAFSFGLAQGRVQKKHGHALWTVGCWWLGALNQTVLSVLRLDFRRAVCAFNSLRGRVQGWMSNE